jgi:hypothetical protein
MRTKSFERKEVDWVSVRDGGRRTTNTGWCARVGEIASEERAGAIDASYLALLGGGADGNRARGARGSHAGAERAGRRAGGGGQGDGGDENSDHRARSGNATCRITQAQAGDWRIAS